MEKKICNECNVEKFVNEYHKRKNGRYGTFAVCKECRRKIAHKKWENNENNIREKNKEYTKKHKEQKEKIIEIKNKKIPIKKIIAELNISTPTYYKLWNDIKCNIY